MRYGFSGFNSGENPQKPLEGSIPYTSRAETTCSPRKTPLTGPLKVRKLGHRALGIVGVAGQARQLLG